MGADDPATSSRQVQSSAAAAAPPGETASIAEEGRDYRILEVVRRRLAAGKPDAARLGQPLQSQAGPVFDGSFSRVYKLLVPGSGGNGSDGGAVAVKIFKALENPSAAAQAARDYHDALVAMDALRAETPELRVARPIALFEDEAAVACEWLDGKTLSKVLLEAPRSEARRAAGDAGAWLARLHRPSRAAQRPVNLALLLADLERSANRVSAPTASFKRAVALLRKTAPALRDVPVPWTRAHGDFKPDNLFACRDGLTGLDFALLEGPVVNDLAHFTNHAALLVYLPRHPRHLGLGGELEAAFLTGYVEAGGTQPPLLPLTWYWLHDAVRLFAARRQWSAGVRARVGGWLLLGLLRRRMRALEQASRFLPA